MFRKIWPFRRFPRTNKWREHCPIFWVTTIDGQKTHEWVMKRRGPDGRWQYRRMTPDEEADIQSSLAW